MRYWGIQIWVSCMKVSKYHTSPTIFPAPYFVLFLCFKSSKGFKSKSLITQGHLWSIPLMSPFPLCRTFLWTSTLRASYYPNEIKLKVMGEPRELILAEARENFIFQWLTAISHVYMCCSCVSMLDQTTRNSQSHYVSRNFTPNPPLGTGFRLHILNLGQPPVSLFSAWTLSIHACSNNMQFLFDCEKEFVECVSLKTEYKSQGNSAIFKDPNTQHC